MKYNVTLNGKIYEVEVEHGEALLLNVSEMPTAPVVNTTVNTQPAPIAPVSVSAGEPIVSPMPGVVLSVEVKSGDMVKSGQLLLILEAMKMENEIVSPRDGRVAQIPAAKGSTVNTGDTLIVLESGC